MRSRIGAAGLAAVVVGVCAGSAHAQFPIKLPKKVVEAIPEDVREKGRAIDNGVREQGREFDKARLRAMSSDPQPGRDYTKLYIKNETAGTLKVALCFESFKFPEKNTGAEVKSYEEPTNPFDFPQVCVLAPGETKHVGNTHNAQVYTYAKNAKGFVWDGKSIYREVDKKEVGFSLEMILAGQEETHTITFRGNGKLVATIESTPQPKPPTRTPTPSKTAPSRPTVDVGSSAQRVVGKPPTGGVGLTGPRAVPGGAAAKTISVQLTNRTSQPVTFHLNGGTGLVTTLNAGQSSPFTVAVDPGVPPTIKVAQLGSGQPPLAFSLENGGRYAFFVQGGKVVNAYDNVPR